MLNEQLHKRYVDGEGRVVRPASAAEVAELDAPPKVWSCHDLVALWLENHPTHRAIRGWIATNEYIFDRHSIVDAGREWIDLTLRVAYQRRFFFVHEGSEADFWSIAPSQQIYQPDGYPADDYEGYADIDPEDNDPPTQAD